MLAADGSAGNVALTCSCMRTHVHGNVQQISFQAQHIQEASLMQLEAWTAALPQHFPKCVSVRLALPNDDSYAGVSGLLAALARQAGWGAAAVVPSVMLCPVLVMPITCTATA